MHHQVQKLGHFRLKGMSLGSVFGFGDHAGCSLKVAEIRRGYIKPGTFGKGFETHAKACFEVARSNAQALFLARRRRG
jgi:hypothetical protein